MIPIADDNTLRTRTPWVTYTLVAVNLGIFIWVVIQPAQVQTDFYARWAAVPSDVATFGPHALLTLLTCTFLHAGWAHVLGNMLYLWIFGDNVEDAMGHGKFLLFYLVCGVVASGVQVVIDWGSSVPLVGASGAIAGVLGAYIVLFPHGGVRTLIVIVPPFFVWPTLPAWLLIGAWIVLQFFSGIQSLGGAMDGTAYFAHIGGFVMGLLIARAFVDRTGLNHRVDVLARTGRRGQGW